jgi:hypothetical protein
MLGNTSLLPSTLGFLIRFRGRYGSPSGSKEWVPKILDP